MKNYIKLTGIVLFASVLLGCEKLAILSTPPKKPMASHSVLATHAEQTFWQTLHSGNYQNIPKTNYLLTAAYLENPNDPQLAAHLGFLHIWAIAERQRLPKANPLVTEHIVLAEKYFHDAVVLNPTDARYLGFYGDTQLIAGEIYHDKRQQTKGYFILKRAITKWPQFNYFTAGYIMSNQPMDSTLYKQAVNWQWRTLDLCAEHKVDRQNPDYRPYMKLETQTGPQRACWNSWIAPFNFEGFFLNMGDMLVKQGNLPVAIKIYRNAQLANNYLQWPYRQVLEQRIKNVEANEKEFNRTLPKNALFTGQVMMFNSKYACMACHQEN